MTTSPSPTKPSYLWFLLVVAGMGGLLAGTDYGIIAGALLYLDKTMPMTPAQQGFMVSIYIFGGAVAALFTAALADLFGRKKLMLVGGLMFVGSILIIYVSKGYGALLLGRILMGLSGGVVCVVVPLYMAECLPSHLRGRGTSMFQLLMTLGFVLAAFIATKFAAWHDAAVTAAAGDARLVFAADDAAWRNMFLTACLPGILFVTACLLVRESPRWLFRKSRAEQAKDILRYTRSEEQAALEFREMAGHAAGSSQSGIGPVATDSLLTRRYVVPFVIACIILAFTQATGINSILSYGPKILQGSGLTEKQAAFNFQVVTWFNCGFTIFAALLVDKLGRKVLLAVGTGGIILCLAAAGFLFSSIESKRTDVLDTIQRSVSADGKTLVVTHPAQLSSLSETTDCQLSVSYKYENDPNPKPKMVTVFSNAEKEADRVLRIEPEKETIWVTKDGVKVEETRTKDYGKLKLLGAKYGPIAPQSTGVTLTVLICAFIAFFAMGPGVCVWLAFTELLPTRIRSLGMGIAMTLNNLVQFASAFLFPVVAGTWGMQYMFFAWAACTVVYFITATFFMPETKGKTLEEIEDHFAGRAKE
jgi:MFS family permease